MSSHALSGAFWAAASVLADLAGFRAAALTVGDGGAITVVLLPLVGTGSVSVRARRGAAARGELEVDGVLLRYEVHPPARATDAALRASLSTWLRRFGSDFGAFEALAAARPVGLEALNEACEVSPLQRWRLAHVETPRLGKEHAETTLDFGEPETERRAFFELTRRAAGLHLRARHRTPAPLAIQEALRVALALALGASTEVARGDGTLANIEAPAASFSKRSLEVVAEPGAHQSDEVRLVLNGPCGQHCSFCSIPDSFPPSDGGETELEAHLAVLQARHREGTRRVRLTGVDPLASSFVLGLVERATALGYEHMTVNSPCTRLADRAFAEALVSAMPKARIFVVPLYGADAAVHDRVVGRAGAHALVRAAIEQLLALLPSASITLSTVLTEDVLSDLSSLVRFADERHLAMNLYLPFPDRDSPLDRYQRVSLPQSEVARRLVLSRSLSVERMFQIRGLLPCVLVRALANEPALLAQAHAWLSSPAAREVNHDGARTARVDCPHRQSCSLTPPCAGTVLGAYAARHGLGELTPPS